MRFERLHCRDIDAPAERVGRLIDGLASDEDRLWPRDRWPTLAIRLDRPLAIGAVGGHGPVRYAVDEYAPSERVVFRFSPGSGLTGTHSLEVEPLADARCRLTHAVDARLGARFAALFPVFRAMHDAVVEDLLDHGELTATGHLAHPPAHAPLLLRLINAIDIGTGGRALGLLAHLNWPGRLRPAKRVAAPGALHRPRGWPRHLAGALSPMALTASRVALERQRGLRAQRLAGGLGDRVRQRMRPTRASMRALSVSPGARFAWRDVPVPPAPGPDAAIVHPIAIATCDLDRALALGATPFLLPLHFGHECVADVLSIGERVATARPGDRVIVPFQISCGRCTRCSVGLTANCESVPPISMYGFGIGGGHWGGAVSDQLAVPYADAMLVPLPDGVEPVAAASVADNISDAYRHIGPHLPTLLARDPASEVLILGAIRKRSLLSASVPLYAGLIARALGAPTVRFVDTRADVRTHATRLGLTALAPGELRGLSAALVVDVSGSARGLRAALSHVGQDGICTSSGGLHNTARIPTGLLFGRNATLHIGRTHSRAIIPKVLELIVAGRVDPESVTTHHASLDDAPHALREHVTGEATKTILSEA